MTEEDVWGTAKSLIEKYGAKAAMEAAMTADRLLARKDKTAHETWKRITLAVRQLESAGSDAH